MSKKVWYSSKELFERNKEKLRATSGWRVEGGLPINELWALPKGAELPLTYHASDSSGFEYFSETVKEVWTKTRWGWLRTHAHDPKEGWVMTQTLTPDGVICTVKG